MIQHAHLGPEYHILTEDEQRQHRQEIREVVLRPLRHTGMAGKIWIASLVIIFLFGCYAYSIQLREGLKVTAMRDYASWGLYISNFVFFVAISLVGALISWPYPVTHCLGCDSSINIPCYKCFVFIFSFVTGYSLMQG